MYFIHKPVRTPKLHVIRIRVRHPRSFGNIPNDINNKRINRNATMIYLLFVNFSLTRSEKIIVIHNTTISICVRGPPSNAEVRIKRILFKLTFPPKDKICFNFFFTFPVRFLCRWCVPLRTLNEHRRL